MKYRFELSFGLLPCQVEALGNTSVFGSECIDFAPDQETERLVMVHMETIRECEKHPDSDCVGIEIATGNLFCAQEIEPGWWNVKIRELNPETARLVLSHILRCEPVEIELHADPEAPPFTEADVN
jgi:hypothetical protein